jgi:tRNA pseudouridine55 synthase
MLGVLLVAKEPGGTSHDVVNAVRRLFGTRRVGHAGTLDPLATGLLVVAVGPATRFLQYLPLEPKEYVADISFGRATTTYDAEGATAFEGAVPDGLEAAVHAVLPRYLGLIQQLPPMYSAVKKDGQPLYRYARQGETVEREPRTVHIGELEILEAGPSMVRARIVCSGGTYVRSLADDIGKDLGCGGFLSGLVRTGVGRFRLDAAKRLSEIGPEDLVPLREALAPMPMFHLDMSEAELVRDGRALQTPNPPDAKHAALVDPSGQVLGVARVTGSILQPECVLPKEVALGGGLPRRS